MTETVYRPFSKNITLMDKNCEDQFKRVVALCEEENTPVENLRDEVYVSDELMQEYKKLVELIGNNPDYNKIQLDQALDKSVCLDPTTEKKYRLWDIDVVEKRNIVFEYYGETF